MIKNLKFNQNSKFKIQNFRLKSFPKILIILFLSVFILQMIFLFFLLAAPVASQAAEVKFAPQVPIPGIEKEFGTLNDGGYVLTDYSTAPIAKYIRLIYNYAIGIIGILAAVVLMVGGVLWIVAGGNATQIGEAKAWIGAALTGLVLALTSYLILSTVNPALVNLQTTGITKVGAPPGMGCCIIPGLPTATYQDLAEKACLATTAGARWQGGVTCHTPCCLWGQSSIPGTFGGLYWTDCLAEKNLTRKDCEDKHPTQRQYMENGECQNATYGKTCKAK